MWKLKCNHVGGVLAWSVVDFGSSQLGHTKNNKISIYCFSAKHAGLRSKNKDWLARN